jgi:hypothetical protein
MELLMAAIKGIQIRGNQSSLLRLGLQHSRFMHTFKLNQQPTAPPQGPTTA